MIDVLLPSLTLMILGLCLWVSLRLLYGARGPAPGDGVHHALSILSWGLLISPALVIAIAATSVLSVILLLIVAEAAAEFIIAKRAAQRRAVWRVLLAALQSSQPLGEALAWHQSRFGGRVGRAFRRLIADVQQGVDWRQSMWENRRAFPREAPALAGLMVRGKEQVDDNASSDQLQDAALAELWQQSLQRLAYLTTVLVVMAGALVFMSMYIAPKLQEIVDDFQVLGVDIPNVESSALGWSWLLGAVLTVSALAAALLCVGVVVLVGLPSVLEFHALQGVADRLLIARHRAQLFRMLAAAISGGIGVDEALGRLSEGWTAYPSRFIRRRAARAHDDIRAGAPWQHALELEGLAAREDAAVLVSAQQLGNLPWALRLLADRKLRILTFRWTLAQQFVFACVILALGLLVFWVASALLAPMVTLIYVVS